MSLSRGFLFPSPQRKNLSAQTPKGFPFLFGPERRQKKNRHPLFFCNKYNFPASQFCFLGTNFRIKNFFQHKSSAEEEKGSSSLTEGRRTVVESWVGGKWNQPFPFFFLGWGKRMVFRTLKARAGPESIERNRTGLLDGVCDVYERELVWKYMFPQFKLFCSLQTENNLLRVYWIEYFQNTKKKEKD